jgi:5-methylcytosine-specific restriction endonuclease McrA
VADRPRLCPHPRLPAVQAETPGMQGQGRHRRHVVELEDGGARFDPDNVQAACRSCNTAKRNTAPLGA